MEQQLSPELLSISKAPFLNVNPAGASSAAAGAGASSAACAAAADAGAWTSSTTAPPTLTNGEEEMVDMVSAETMEEVEERRESISTA